MHTSVIKKKKETIMPTIELDEHTSAPRHTFAVQSTPYNHIFGSIYDMDICMDLMGIFLFVAEMASN